MSADSERDRLPFEPTRKQKKKQKVEAAAASRKAPKAGTKSESSSSHRSKRSKEDTSIPEVVSRRMLRRMIFFSGIPVGTGVLIFFASYFAITRDLVQLPNVAVLLVTLGC
ncbi:MAG: DUF3464 family protein, partial [Leptolyngbya sp. SIO1D8]|nr:DUF3464 family protein [Leptolyngbya sp. SIO1D8]